MIGRKQILIAALVAIAITVVYAFVLLRPKLAQIAETKKEIEAAQTQQQTLAREITRLEAIRRDAPATIARLARITRLLPSEPQMPAFIRAVQAASEEAGVDLLSIAPSQPGNLTGSSGIETINVTLVMEGAYARIQDLLARLEGLERIVEITAITLSPVTDPLSRGTTLSATLSMTMYVVQPNASLRAPTPGATPSPEAS